MEEKDQTSLGVASIDAASGAKAPSTTAAAPEKKPEPKEFVQKLEEFCANLSQTERRYELIAGFDHSERKAGKTTDLPSNYMKRWLEYGDKPSLLPTSKKR